jgi:hypothetical protein
MMDRSPGVKPAGTSMDPLGGLGCGSASRMGARPILFSLSPVYGTVAPRNQIASPGQIRNCPEGKVRTRAYSGPVAGAGRAPRQNTVRARITVPLPPRCRSIPVLCGRPDADALD